MSPAPGDTVPRSASRFPALWFGSVLLVTVLLRVLVYSQTRPMTFPDSPYYQLLAEWVTHGELLDPEGARTPAYPVFLALLGLDPDRARIAQMVMGTLITAMLFAMAWRITRSIRVSVGVALCHGLNLSQLKFESMIATETLTTTCITLSLLAMVWFESSAGTRRAGTWLLVAGAASALAGFTRPLFGFLPLVVVVAAHGARPTLGRRWLVAALLPFLVLVGGLSLANGARLGFLGPTTLAGYNLMNHAGGFVDDAPDRYAVVRDIYLADRQKAAAQGRTHVMVIWGSIPAMRQATGMTYAGLSRHLSRMCLELFVKHPWSYARSVGVSWAYFWAGQGTGSWSPSGDGRVAQLLVPAWRIERLLFVALHLLFLSTMGLMILGWGRWGRKLHRTAFVTTLAGSVVLIASVVQALMERGDNARYGAPVQPLVALVVLVMAWDLLGRPGHAGAAAALTP
jgi:hypothetical protein